MLRYTDSMNNASIVGIIRRACNCVDERLMDHGFRVSFIVSRLLEAQGTYSLKEMRDICLAALLHDIGAYKTEEITKMLQFETRNVKEHSVYSELFIRHFSPLKEYAPAILYHHEGWKELEERKDIPLKQKETAQLICIADRLDVYIRNDRLNWDKFSEYIRTVRGVKFSPQVTDLMLKQDFMDLTDEFMDTDERYLHLLYDLPFTQEEISQYLEMIIYTIDFRSYHTVTHTCTTTSLSYEIGKRMNLEETYLHQIVCGALLHDMGKIGIPVEILEYPGKLGPQAMNIMRTHVDITEKILGDGISQVVKNCALRHHEKLDGSGYPRGLSAKDLTVGDRIVAVADILSALAGTRSYKEAYDKERILHIMRQMCQDGLIDKEITAFAERDFDEMMHITRERCEPVVKLYQQIRMEYEAMLGYEPKEERPYEPW